MRSTSEAAVAAGISLLALAIYAITLAPSVPGGDSGELIAAAYTGGVPHPAWVPALHPVGVGDVRNSFRGSSVSGECVVSAS